MGDSLRTIRALLLLSPLLLTGCDTMDFAFIDLPKINWPWASADEAPKTVTAQRDEEPAKIPDGMQTDDLRMPFGAMAAAP
ncbi:MAG TPA: hypothetical protein VGF56_16520 [Rhizomicrobium sp.]|jgi:hypothetical protein